VSSNLTDPTFFGNAVTPRPSFFGRCFNLPLGF
jgi:hypothetical protein